MQQKALSVNRFFVKPVMLEEEFEVLYEILLSPKVNVNRLYSKMKGKISKARLLNILRKLNREGLIEVVRDPRHKQRLLLSVREDVRSIANYILSPLSGPKGSNVLGKIEGLVGAYLEIARRISNPEVKEFLRMLVARQVDNLLASEL